MLYFRGGQHVDRHVLAGRSRLILSELEFLEITVVLGQKSRNQSDIESEDFLRNHYFLKSHFRSGLCIFAVASVDKFATPALFELNNIFTLSKTNVFIDQAVC